MWLVATGTYLRIEFSFLAARQKGRRSREGDQTSNEGARSERAVQKEAQRAPGGDAFGHELGAHGFVQTAFLFPFGKEGCRGCRPRHSGGALCRTRRRRCFLVRQTPPTKLPAERKLPPR